MTDIGCALNGDTTQAYHFCEEVGYILRLVDVTKQDCVKQTVVHELRPILAPAVEDIHALNLFGEFATEVEHLRYVVEFSALQLTLTAVFPHSLKPATAVGRGTRVKAPATDDRLHGVVCHTVTADIMVCPLAGSAHYADRGHALRSWELCHHVREIKERSAVSNQHVGVTLLHEGDERLLHVSLVGEQM